MSELKVQLTATGLARWKTLHPWIFVNDCDAPSAMPAGIVTVVSPKGQVLGQAFFSPHSQIMLRRLSTTAEPLTVDFWRTRLKMAIARRKELEPSTNAYRVVFGESDGMPSIIIDRYNDIAVIQTLSAGAETVKDVVCDLVMELLPVTSLVERNDVSVRELEKLPLIKKRLRGKKTQTEIRDGHLVFEVDCLEGQKTGAFLDHRASRRRMAQLAKGRVLDCFSYEGWGACYMAPAATEVVVAEISAQACGRIAANVDRNGFTNVQIETVDVFDYLRACDHRGEKFDLIHLDPPAFIKNRRNLVTGIAGYKEINLRAMRCLKPGGVLVTNSCSQHFTVDLMREMLQSASADVGRECIVRETVGQDLDHPVLLSFPESHYLKGFVLEVL